MSERQLYVGLMSGTSIDAIDAGLVDFSSDNPSLVASHSHDIPIDIKRRIAELCSPQTTSTQSSEIDCYGELHIQLGQLFSEACLALLEKANIPPEDVIAIGNHGQTVRHRPNGDFPFSLQIADPNTIAQRTGITTVADFRLRDMAAGGQGAPLVPAFHQAIFHSDKTNRIILNIGGIANITVLEKNNSSKVLGFDTGPGNTLMDQWIQKIKNEAYDNDGEWAKSGTANADLLKKLLSHPYLPEPAPKSTGREVFNLHWLNSILSKADELKPEDVQRTLLDFTSISIAQSIKDLSIKHGEVLVCGGGSHNRLLMASLAEQLPEFSVGTSADAGYPADWIEAMAFAWLAKQTLNHLPGNLPHVTGANAQVILGGIYFK